MFSSRWNKVLRELWGNKARTTLVVLSIAVGVLAVGMATGARVILSRELPAGYAATDPAHAVLRTDPFDDGLVQTVRRMSGVRDAEGRRNIVVRLKTGPNEWRDIALFAIPDYSDIHINKIEPESGAWPPPAHELLIERAALSLTKANVGDWVLIETPDAKQRELRIAGLAHDQSRPPASFEGTAYGYITYETLEWLGQPRDYNELYITVSENADAQEHIQSVAAQVRDKVEKSGRIVFATTVPAPGKLPLEDAVQAIVLLLGVFGFLSLALSGLLVINTISAILAQQVRQIGMMKAIGARRRQVAAIYLGMALIFGLLAVAVGAPLGVLGARGLSVFVAGLINADVANLSISPSVLALEAIIGLLAPLLAALYPVIAGSRVTVREAISDYGLGKDQFGTSRIDRLLERVRGLSRPLLISLRNTFRRKGRLALTLSTLTLGSAVFIALTSVYASALVSSEDLFRYWQYDVQFSFNRAQRIEKIEREALNVPGVVQAEHWTLIGTSLVHADGSEGEHIWMYALPANTFSLRPKIIAGRWLLPEDENAVVINHRLRDKVPGAKVGDQIVLKVQGKKVAWRIVGIVHMMYPPDPIVYVNAPYFARVVGTVGRAEGVYVVLSQHDAAFQSQVARALEEHFRSIGVRITSMLLFSTLRATVETLFTSVVALLLIMAILVATVGGLGLTGIMSLNVLERTREIGVMRAIGASGGGVLQIVLGEGIVIGLISWFLGCLLALPLSRLLNDAVGMALVQTPFSYTFSTSGALLWLVLVIILTVVASAWPARNASRLTVREALAYE